MSQEVCNMKKAILRSSCPRARFRSGIAAGEPGFAAPLGEGPNAQDVGGAFGHADRAPGVEQIEEVASLQALVVGWQGQAAINQHSALRLGIGEMSNQPGRVGELEIEGREYALGAPEDLAIADPAGSRDAVVIEIKHIFDALNKHRQS